MQQNSLYRKPLFLRLLVIIALLLEVSCSLMHVACTRGEQAGWVLASYAVGGAAFIWLLWLLRRSGNVHADRRAIILLLAAAAVFRITLLPLPPASSTDVYRYLWEGVVQREGFDPFVTPPDDPALASLAREYANIHVSINHPEIPTIYPPVAQGLFLLNATLFDGSLMGWKLILFGFDLILAAVLWSLLRARGSPLIWLAGVLWCPLLLIETYEGGHLDVIGVALLALAVVAAIRNRPGLAGVALGLCVNVKYLWPMSVLVFLALRARRRRDGLLMVVTASFVAVACWIPYRSALPAAWSTARMFTETWTFNGTIFEMLRALPGPAWLPMLLVMIGLVALAFVLARRKSGDLWSDVWLLTGVGLVLSPVAFPWYFIWIVPGLAVRPPAWLTVWILLVPALHIVDWRHWRTGEWHPMPWLWILVGVIPAVLLVKGLWDRVTRGEPSAPGALPDGSGCRT